ncbi:MAG TPA: nuclear transport factor 2 family protein [Polyangiales bacterium]
MPSAAYRACLLLCFGSALLSCARAPSARAPLQLSQLAALEAGRWEWVSSACVDGPLDLAKLGFERSLRIEAHGSSLRFSYDTRFAQPACAATEVWTLAPEPGGQWQLTPEALVKLPADAPCGAFEPSVGHGVLRLSGDSLEELRFASPWCRGFDARFVYRRLPAAALDPLELVRHYVAHWNRRDASAVAALFSEQAVLIEPFSRSQDGSALRHQGREQLRRWYAQAFASTPWLGMGLQDAQALGDSGEVLASWRYMDPRLLAPLRGRNLFVMAGGEILASEIQVLSEPTPAAAP